MANSNQTDKIKCPECNVLIPITETLQHQLTESVRKEYEERLAEQKCSLSKQQKELTQKEKTIEENCQMLCKTHNRAKGNR